MAQPGRVNTMRRLCPRTTGLLLLLQAFALPVFGQGKGHGVEVRAPAEAAVPARAAEVISIPFVVTNHTADLQELVETLRSRATAELPPGWQTVLPLPGFRLAAGASETRLVVCRVAPGAAGGTYDLTYAVSSRRDPAVRDDQSLQVSVASFAQLALQAESPPSRLVAGRSSAITLRLFNGGNVPLQVSLAATGPGGLSAVLSPATLSLEARAAGAVTLTVQAPDLKASGVRVVTVTADGAPATGHGVQATLSLPFTVLPRATSLPSLSHTLPVEAALSVAGDTSGANWQMEVSGRGTLDEAGTQQVDFRFRGPDATGQGFFGSRDEYVANYSDPTMDLRVGDQAYGLSDLTDRSLYGRGVGVTYRPTRTTECGAWRANPRWDDPAGAATGAFVRQDLGSGTRVKANWLQRESRGDGTPGADNLISVQAELHPLPGTSVGVEVARDEPEIGRSDEAWRLRGNGRLGKVGEWSFNHVSAGPQYRGYYEDCRTTTATVSAWLSQQARLQYAFTHWRTNLAREPEDSDPSTDETLHRVSLQAALNKHWGLTLGLDQFEVLDVAAPDRTHFASQRLWSAVTHTSDRTSVRLEVRHEARDDYAAHTQTNTLEGRLFASYSPSDNLSLSVYGGWRDGRARGRPDPLSGSNDLGFAALWRPDPSTQVRAWMGQYHTSGTAANTTVQSGLAVEHRDRNGRRLALEVRRGDSAGRGRQTDYLLTYTIPFELPVGGLQTVGAVSGRLHDQAGAPVVDAVVTLDGDSVVSDRDGRFGFGGVKPGKHVLSVDVGTLGGRLPEREPGPVEVVGGEMISLDLCVVAAARVSGVVSITAVSAAEAGAVVGDPGRGDLADGTGVPNLVVELIREGDKPRRQCTDGLGRFTFEGLRPGAWHMKVYPANLPPLHRLEQPERDLALQGGATCDVKVGVTPMARQMRMLRPAVVPVATAAPKPGLPPPPERPAAPPAQP